MQGNAVGEVGNGWGDGGHGVGVDDAGDGEGLVILVALDLRPFLDAQIGGAGRVGEDIQ